MTLQKWLATWLFNLAYRVDYRAVTKCIEDMEYIQVDEAYDYVCSNYP